MPALPDQIGRYQIKSLIGRGGMGNLYLAHDPNTNRLVTVKLLNATLDSTELRERFAREGRALAALSHPNIVNIYDSGEYDGSPFIVMEYVRGETLAELIKRCAPLSVSQKLKLMAELCAGLAQAHDVGIIHRDIKPANLMVDQQGRLKILDFGIARFAESNRTRIGLPLTRLDMIIGTPGYMSPEQIEGGEVDHRCDIFAVGAVCYELLSCTEAFAAGDSRSVERRVLQAQPKPLSALLPELDPEIDEIILRALKRDPNKRFQDAATFERALERLRARLDSQRSVQPPGRPAAPTEGQSAGSSARQARAEAAYQRAVAARDEGGIEAARRFASEALAEDPSHVEARALLTHLEPRRAVPLTEQSSASPQATVADTSVDVGKATINAAPTVIVTSVPATVKSRHEPERTPSRLPDRGRSPSPGAHNARSTSGWLFAFRQQYPLVWKRHQKAIIAAGAALIAVAIVSVAMWALVLGPSGEVLTVDRPVGGTLTASGINCGTRGNACSTTLTRGEAIELVPEADAGFAFNGFTGSCAPGGRTLMNGARHCGATFEKIAEVASATPTQQLTIAPVPQGGTLEGIDIICGTKGSTCSANYPEGVPVELHPTADANYTFMGFTGDCAPLGHTQMTGARTCGATFSPTAEVSSAPPVSPPVRTGRPVAIQEVPPPRPPAPASPGSPGPAPAPTNQPPREPVLPQNDVKQPISAEAFAKERIKELLHSYCEAYEKLDPDAVQKLYPTVNMDQLRTQLNSSAYKSVMCKFEEPTFESLQATEGKAKVKVEVKRVFEHRIQQKPTTSELIATITLVRAEPRSPWLIENAGYVVKPK